MAVDYCLLANKPYQKNIYGKRKPHHHYKLKICLDVLGNTNNSVGIAAKKITKSF